MTRLIIIDIAATLLFASVFAQLPYHHYAVNVLMFYMWGVAISGAALMMIPGVVIKEGMGDLSDSQARMGYLKTRSMLWMFAAAALGWWITAVVYAFGQISIFMAIDDYEPEVDDRGEFDIPVEDWRVPGVVISPGDEIWGPDVNGSYHKYTKISDEELS